MISHPAPALALATLFGAPRLPASVVLAGVVCSIVPDADVLTFRFGVPYGAMLGHRGLTHSFAFALMLGGLVTLCLRRRAGHVSLRRVWLYLTAATASHGICDAFTDGGLGVAFLAPFSDARYFFPMRPIEVSPLSITQFVSRRGASILLSEARWIWLPSALFSALVLWLRSRRNHGKGQPP